MTELDRTFWEQRWETAAHTAGMSTPNRTLTDAVVGLPAGRALDAGCGLGADAIWLAQNGWAVTAVDFVDSALQCARDRAEQTGPDVAARIEWRQADLSIWTPPPAAFDLVTTHYLHGVAQRDLLFRRLAVAVRPGGTLLVVGHHPSNADISGGTMPDAVFFTSADVVSVLDEGWELLTVDDDVPRRTANHGGAEITLRSAVVRARRAHH
ncbi:class I SAM-dependent methyltransferase [Mycobacterium sp. IS-3022]|uniref:class I SAM-dependent methyltransferase n=1 Tax=Mycobacterium sp. IS-3022 TaxID=1772277 RepID=UPI0009E6718E|nr:class I SAM-dependent methyltransferase [Mycobacterium sp. IS-3022]